MTALRDLELDVLTDFAAGRNLRTQVVELEGALREVRDELELCEKAGGAG